MQATKEKLDQTFDQAEVLIDDYIHLYNFERLQLKYRLTPFQNDVNLRKFKIFYDMLFSSLSIYSGAIHKGAPSFL